jgi:microcystin-dependent protein/uncharacterized protein YjbI with pentapeptide repeats
MTSYKISDLNYNINGSTNTIQYSELFSDIVPWGINATYIYKSDVVFDTQFDNNNNNDLIIENKRNNIILKTPNTMKTDIKNLAVEKLYIREVSTNNFNSCPYIYNKSNIVTVEGNFRVSGDFVIGGNVSVTGTYVQANIINPEITGGTIQRSLISDLSIVNVKIFDSSVNNCSMQNNSLYGTNKLYGTLLGQSSGIREIKDCIFNGGFLRGSISTIDADITNITINQGTLNTCTIKNGSASDISINRFTLSGGTINKSVANDITINRPTLSGGTISYSVANNISINSPTLTGGTIINSDANNLTITGFTLSGGTINNSFFNNNTTNIINLSGGTITYSTITDTLLTNNSLNGTLRGNGIGNINNCYLNDSSINRTSISGGTLRFALINNSLLNDSSINNCILSGGTLRFAILTNSLLNDSSINNTSMSGGTIQNCVLSNSFINNSSLSGGTILATNIGCNDAGIPNIPKRGAFTNINIFNNNNNSLTINSNGNIDSSGTISGANITSLGTLSAGTISSGNITSTGTINGVNITTSGTLNAGIIVSGTIGSGNITSNSTISSVNNNVSNKIVANSLDIRSGGILDVSQGTIRANIISGEKTHIRLNANYNTIPVMSILTGFVPTSSADGTPMNGIAINNRNVATTQHIRNAIPPGIILAYYSSTTPSTAPEGWVICDGQNSTPDLRGRFILGADPTNARGSAITKIPNNSSGEENVFLNTNQIPPHTHNYRYTQIGYTGNSFSNGNNRYAANTHAYFYEETGAGPGLGQSHNNMPPYWVLIYIMKTSTYNFNYV